MPPPPAPQADEQDDSGSGHADDLNGTSADGLVTSGDLGDETPSGSPAPGRPSQLRHSGPGRQQRQQAKANNDGAQQQDGDATGGGQAAGGKAGARQKLPRPENNEPCPRCHSKETKFCYYNNYNVKQPRFYCKACQRYWTAGGTLRNVPPGSGRRKSKSAATKEQEKQQHLAEQLAKQSVANAMLAANPATLAAAVPFLNPMLAAESTMLAYAGHAAQQQALLGTAAFSAALTKMPGTGWPGATTPMNGLLSGGADSAAGGLGSPTVLLNGQASNGHYPAALNGSGHLLQPLGSPGATGTGSDGTHLNHTGDLAAAGEASGGTTPGLTSGKPSKRQKLDPQGSGGGSKQRQDAQQAYQQQQQQQQHEPLDALGMLGPSPVAGHSSAGGALLGSAGVMSNGVANGLGNGAAGDAAGAADASALGSNGHHNAHALQQHAAHLGMHQMAGMAQGNSALVSPLVNGWHDLLGAAGMAGTASATATDALSVNPYASAGMAAGAAAQQQSAVAAAAAVALQQQQQQQQQQLVHYQQMMHAQLLQQQLAAAQAPNPYLSLQHLYGHFGYNPAAAVAANLAGYSHGAGR